MKPIIGMNMDISPGPPRKVWLYATYHEAIVAAGGIPILLPPVAENDLDYLLDQLNGVLLTGGDDYDPALYGESKHPTVDLMDEQRQGFDLALMKQLMNRREMPVLGLCGGVQLMNIAFGGSLIQDIATYMPDSKVRRKGEAGWKVKDWYEVQLEPGSKLKDIYKKERLNVPINAHQGINVIGKGLKCAARADDGLATALEATDHRFCIGVEWHPERDLVGSEPLFTAFLAEAKVTQTGH